MQRNLQKSLKEVDPEVAEIISNEEKRQRGGLQLIASEVRFGVYQQQAYVVELCFDGCSRSRRFGSHKQVLGGLSWRTVHAHL